MGIFSHYARLVDNDKDKKNLIGYIYWGYLEWGGWLFTFSDTMRKLRFSFGFILIIICYNFDIKKA